MFIPAVISTNGTQKALIDYLPGAGHHSRQRGREDEWNTFKQFLVHFRKTGGTYLRIIEEIKRR